MLPITGISASFLRLATPKMDQQKKKVFSDRKTTANTMKTRSETLGIQIKDWIFKSICF